MLDIKVHQPLKVKTGNLDEWLEQQGAEAAVVMAYGRLLPTRVLETPRLGCINLHASLLPRYRGAAPINWALIRGETETGISIMKMVEEMDAGPVYAQERLAIDPAWDAGNLSEALASLAADALRQHLPDILQGKRSAAAQDPTLVTFAPPLTKQDSVIDFSDAAQAIVNRVRGLSPRPGAHTTLRGKRLKLLEVSTGPTGVHAEPGSIVLADSNSIVVATGQGGLRIERAQLEGRKALAARDLVNGRALTQGDQLGS